MKQKLILLASVMFLLVPDLTLAANNSYSISKFKKSKVGVKKYEY